MTTEQEIEINQRVQNNLSVLRKNGSYRVIKKIESATCIIQGDSRSFVIENKEVTPIPSGDELMSSLLIQPDNSLGLMRKSSSLRQSVKALGPEVNKVTLTDTIVKLKPYFTPTLSNWTRFCGLCCGIILIPAASGLPFVLLDQNICI